MVNTATTAITQESMKKVIALSEHEPLVLDFSSQGSDAAAGMVAGSAAGGD